MYLIIFYIALFSGFIPLIILFYRQGATGSIKYPVAPFIWLTAIASLYELVATVILKVNTTYWFQVYSLLELTTVYFFFFKTSQERYRAINKVLLLLLIASYIASLYFWSNNGALLSNAINHISITVFVIISLLLWVRNLFKETKVTNLWEYADFYFVAAISIYYFSTVFLFLLSNFIFNSHLYFMSDYWLLNVIVTLILRVILSIGVWKMK